MQEVRALSFKQPFADLIIYHNKIETRTWNTKYRGLVLICSSKSSPTIADWVHFYGAYQAERIYNLLSEDPNLKDHNRGHALAIATLADSRPMKPEDANQCFVEYNPALYCHIYKDVQPIEPFPWTGAKGWRKLTEQQIRHINNLDGSPFFFPYFSPFK